MISCSPALHYPWALALQKWSWWVKCAHWQLTGTTTTTRTLQNKSQGEWRCSPLMRGRATGWLEELGSDWKHWERQREETSVTFGVNFTQVNKQVCGRAAVPESLQTPSERHLHILLLYEHRRLLLTSMLTRGSHLCWPLTPVHSVCTAKLITPPNRLLWITCKTFF